MFAQCRIVAAKRPGLDNFGHHPTLKIVEACYFHIGFRYTTKCKRLFRYSTTAQQQSLQCLKIRMIPLRFRGLASALLPNVKVYCPFQNGCVGGYCIKPRNPPNSRFCETLRPHGQLIFLPAPGFHLHLGLTLYRNHCPHPQSEDTVDRTSKGIMTLGSSSVESTFSLEPQNLQLPPSLRVIHPSARQTQSLRSKTSCVNKTTRNGTP